MNRIVHEVIRHISICIRKSGIEVQPEHALPVGELAKKRIRLKVAPVRGIVVLDRPAGPGTARKDRQENDFRLRLLLAHDLQDSLHPSRDILRARIPRRIVVRPDHHHHDLRPVAVQLAVCDAPERILRTVAPVSEIDRRIAIRENRPAGRMLPLPEVRDGIAHHGDIDRSALKRRNLSEMVVEPVLPPLIPERAGLEILLDPRLVRVVRNRLARLAPRRIQLQH